MCKVLKTLESRNEVKHFAGRFLRFKSLPLAGGIHMDGGLGVFPHVPTVVFVQFPNNNTSLPGISANSECIREVMRAVLTLILSQACIF